ncbi:MAG: GerAB/ArcD/ProY family transporter [Clostridia bacterium]|nr:GerAB/ArcD/ProY family transporter [Clostridia bacterium]
MKSKLTFFEAISVIASITIAQIILDFPEYLIDITGTGTIINLLFLSVISIVFCIIITKIFKHFSNQDIIDISEMIGGNFLKFIVSILFLIFLFLTTIIAISNFLYLIKTVYFQEAHPLFIFSVFIIAIFISSQKGFYSIKKISTLSLGILVISIISLLFGDNGNFNSNNLILVFGYNYHTTFQTGLINIFIFNFMIIYFFLMPLLSRKNDFPKIIFSSFGINLILLLISVISILLYYPTSITKELTNLNAINTIFLVTRRIQLNSFLSQTDSIFVFIWSFAILNYILILVNGMIHILDKLFHYEDKAKLSTPIISILIGGTFLIDRIIQLEYLEQNIFKHYSIILTFGIFTFILVLGYFKNKKKGTKNAQNTK